MEQAHWVIVVASAILAGVSIRAHGQSPEQGTIEVASSPVGIAIEIGGKRVGKTPVSVPYSRERLRAPARGESVPEYVVFHALPEGRDHCSQFRVITPADALPDSLHFDMTACGAKPGLVYPVDDVDEEPDGFRFKRLDLPDARRRPQGSARVTMQFVVDTTGSVDPDLIVTVTATDPGFERMTLDAILESRLSPGRVEGQAVGVFMEKTFRFRHCGTDPPANPMSAYYWCNDPSASRVRVRGATKR